MTFSELFFAYTDKTAIFGNYLGEMLLLSCFLFLILELDSPTLFQQLASSESDLYILTFSLLQFHYFKHAVFFKKQQFYSVFIRVILKYLLKKDPSFKSETRYLISAPKLN